MRWEAAFRKLEDSFFRNLDLASVDAAMGEVSAGRLPPNLLEIGAGSHFQAWILRSAFGEICVKKPHMRTFVSSSAKEVWLGHLGELQQRRVPLVPPMRWLPYSGVLAMPIGTKATESRDEQHFQELLRQFSAATTLLHLVLDDPPQWGVSQGVPFLYDFSDIRRELT